ncbi:transcription factor HES-7.1-like [Corythoichthys intestinalis]|uniref:transcription factor HES-7.1-like n=1 Tax=Corythoichthys intestinalis TaxID=161448 RepID=UPI0025A5C89A|nr:transcription factor HES-7.1-like [Corythoichthys intestinalis]XP_057691017.1 transcription factor HES-7.1-like [Corythoichthys intestinalis]XP_061789008.1 transcription factor HES-7.1-like [Nerophis lumbriciformis]
MKLMQEADDANRDKKLLKSQVEKRRRERMNHSLERLRSMLMQEPQQQQQQGASQRRVEKTEILEHTVLFLHNTSKATSGAQPQQHSFQDGFHTCLQRAAHFLGPQGKGLWLALDATLAPRSPSSSSSSSSVLHALRHKSKHNRRAAAPPPRTPPQGPNWLGTCMESPPAEGPSLGQSVWRPWP